MKSEIRDAFQNADRSLRRSYKQVENKGEKEKVWNKDGKRVECEFDSISIRKQEIKMTFLESLTSPDL